MASNGIKDRVAIVGMGCTIRRALGQGRRGPAGRRCPGGLRARRASTPHRSTPTGSAPWQRHLRPDALRGAEDSVQAGDALENMCATGSEAIRNAAYAVASGAYDLVMAIGVEKLKDSGYSGLRAATRRTTARSSSMTRAGDLRAARAGVRQEVRRRRGPAEAGARAHRVEEPQERREEPKGAVPQRSADGDHLQVAGGRRHARHLRLLGRQRRLRRGDPVPRRGRAQVLAAPDLHQGAVVRRRPGRRATSARTTTSRRSPKSSPARRTPTSRPASRTRAKRSAWRRCTTASRRPSWC